jgi:hypothetical protein
MWFRGSASKIDLQRPERSRQMTVTVSVVVESSLDPDQVLAAACDFSARRPEVWTNITADLYTVHRAGETSADVTEGGRMGPLVAWERSDYDWSRPGSVKATVMDSNVYTPTESSWEIRATPTAKGSRVEMIWVRGFKRNFTARFLATGYRLGGKRLFTPDARKMLSTLERLEKGEVT